MINYPQSEFGVKTKNSGNFYQLTKISTIPYQVHSCRVEVGSKNLIKKNFPQDVLPALACRRAHGSPSLI